MMKHEIGSSKAPEKRMTQEEKSGHVQEMVGWDPWAPNMCIHKTKDLLEKEILGQ